MRLHTNVKTMLAFIEFVIDWNAFVSDNHSVYNYVDRTIDDETAVYVGMGSGPRVRHKRARNKKHLDVALKHGIKRTVVAAFTAEDRQLACENESRLIAELGTFSTRNNKGCNFTSGGDGTANHVVSSEEKKRRSLRQTGDNNIAKRPDVRKKISESQRGKVFSDERRSNISIARLKSVVSPESKERQKLSMKRLDVRQKLSAARCRNFAHLVPIHDEVCRLKSLGLKHIDIANAVSTTFNARINYSRVTNILHAHRKGLCRTCNVNRPSQYIDSVVQNDFKAS